MSSAAPETDETILFKNCLICCKNKSIDNFHYLKSSARYYTYCKPCARVAHREWRTKNQARHRENCLAWIKRNPEAVKGRSYSRKYGISYAAFLEMIEAQHGRCAICRTEINSMTAEKHSRRAVLDHCHSTGAVRGALCNLCNSGIGFLQDSPEIAAAATAYLRRTNYRVVT